MEGGANVLSEALVSGVPVLASRISGSIGMLGETYSGYFPVGGTRELTALMERCEGDTRFYARLQRECARRSRLFQPEYERQSWQKLLKSIGIA